MKNLKVKKGIAICLVTSLVLVTGCTRNNSQTSISQRIQTETTDNNEQTKDFDNFQTEQEEIENYMFQENFDLAKEKGKEYFIKGIDFIFYDAEYKGITFDELKDEAKKETLKNLNILDGYVMELDPDYKETLQEKYQIVSEFISEKYYSVLDKIKEYIGEENYNAIKNIKDQIKNDAKDIGQKTKTKVSDWYQDFKQN